MKSSIDVEAVQIAVDAEQVDPRSLYATLQQVTDHRDKRGRRYEAAVVLTMLLLAKLAGETTLSGIADWVSLRALWLWHVIPLQQVRTPCANTYRYVCNHLDMDEACRLLASFFGPGVIEIGDRGSRHLAVDGKTLRGTRQVTPISQDGIHLLEIYDITNRYLLRQRRVEGKGQERQAAMAALTRLDLRGCVISADALYTQRSWCQQVREQNGDYLLIVKANQPTLHADIALLFSRAPVPWLHEGEARTIEKGHGRLQIRRIRISHELNDFLQPTWSDVAQVFQVEREITRQGETTTEVAYGFTSLPATVATPRNILTLTRAHWHIENRVHWRRDVTMHEDACRVRTGQAPEVLAVLNNAVLALMDRLGVNNMAAQMRTFAARPAEALALLLQPL